MTASSATSVVTSGDLAVNSISFEVRLSTSGPTDCAALWDANEDGYLDLAITGSGPTGGPEQGLYKNPGATGNPWQLFYTPNELGRR